MFLVALVYLSVCLSVDNITPTVLQVLLHHFQKEVLFLVALVCLSVSNIIQKVMNGLQ